MKRRVSEQVSEHHKRNSRDGNKLKQECAFSLLIVDVIYRILEYLDSNSFIAFQCSCWYLATLMKSEISMQIAARIYTRHMQREALKRIQQHLAEMGLLDYFLRFARECNARIVGSFPLMHLHNAIWANFKLDIVVPRIYKLTDDGSRIELHIEDEDTMTALVRHYFPGVLMRTYINQAYIDFHEIDTKHIAAQGLLSHAIAVQELLQHYKATGSQVVFGNSYPSEAYFEKYSAPVIVLKFIFTKSESVCEYVDAHCDLSICKIYTDADSELCCYNFEQQWEMESFVHNPKCRQRLKQRMAKYESRGFIMHAHDDRSV